MAQTAHVSTVAKTAPKKEQAGPAVVAPKRATTAVQRVAPRHAPCACGGHCPKCRPAAPPPRLEAEEQPEAEKEAEQVAALLAQAFAAAPPPPPPEDNSRTSPPARPRLRKTGAPDPTLGSGIPLPEPIRRRLEPALGYDLSSLTVHIGPAADTLAGQYGARAFAYGSHLVFARGEYAPHDARGRQALAHEVVHAVQQGSLAHDPWRQGTVSQQARPRGPPARVATPISIQHRLAAPCVQRLPSWNDVSNAASDFGGAVVDTGSAAVGAVVDIGEGAVELGAEALERTADFFIGLVDEYAPGLLTFLRGGFASRLMDLFCRGLDAVIGGLISSLEDIDFVSALEEAFASAQGSVEGVIGSIRSGASSALGSLMQPVVEALDEYGPGIIDAITGAGDSVNGFFDSIWESVGAPAMDFLGEAGGAIWREVTELVDWLWEATSDVRELAADAWDWVMSQFEIAWESTSGIRDWLAEKATEAWETITEALGPLEGPIMVLGGALLILSPLGPIIIATQVIPPLWEKLTWLWNNWNSDDILVWAQDTLREDILPGVISLVSGVASAISSAAAWIAGVTVDVAQAFGGVLSAFGGNECLATVTRVLNAVSAQFDRLSAWAEGGFTGLAEAVSNVFDSLVAILQPILDFLIRLFMVVTNPPLLPIAIAGAIWLLIPDELKPPVINFVLDLIIAFLRGFPAFLTSLGPLASILKAGFLGFLEGLRAAEDQQKIDASNKVANLMAGGGLAFVAGFAIGILEGLLDGILDPFRLIWMLIQFLARLCRAIGDYLAPLLFEAAPELGTAVGDFNAAVRATIPDRPPPHAPAAEASSGGTGTLTRASSAESGTGTIARATPGAPTGPTAAAPPAGTSAPAATPEDAAMAEILGSGPTATDADIVASLSPGTAGALTGAAGELEAASSEGESSAESEVRTEGASVGGLSSLLGGIWTAILDGAHGLGGRAAGALLEFLMLSDYELGNKIGYVAGIVLLEVIVAYFSGGVSVELKAAEPFIKAAIRFLDLGGEILGLLGRALRPIKGPLLRGLSSAGEHLSRFRFLEPVLSRIRRGADTLFHFGDEAADVATSAGRRADDAADAARAGSRVDDAASAGRHVDDVPGAGRRADDAADGTRHTDDAADASRKATELPAAIAAARAITDANDARDTPPPLLIPQLLTLRSRYRWINGFEANWSGVPGRYRIVMRASTHEIKDPYTTDPASPDDVAEMVDTTPPGTLGNNVELNTPLSNPPHVVGPNPNPAPPMRGDTGGRTYTSTSRTTRPIGGTSTPEVSYRRGGSGRSTGEFTPSAADDAAMAEARAARDRAVETHRGLPEADQGRTVATGTGPDGPTRTSGGYTADAPGGAGRVEARAAETGHDLRRHAHDPPGSPGRYHASHAEKQAITDRPGGGAGVSRDQCDDCIAFFRREAAHQRRPITVSDPSCDRIFHADGSVTEFWNHGPVVRYRPDGTVSVMPSRPVQPKLAITRPGDTYEREADRVAEAVSSSGAHAIPGISAYQEHAALPATMAADTRSSGGTNFERALDSGESGGSTLPAATRTRMEDRFGVDFSSVRVHTDGQSAALNRQVDSLAFTTGRHVYFAPGEYRPGTAGGDRLLAHELTHVVQQGGGSGAHRPIQRFETKKYYAYGLLSGRNTHEIAENALRSVNSDLVTEAPIPGATTDAMFGPGPNETYFDKVGRADLFQSSNKGEAIGLKGFFGGKDGASRHDLHPEFKYAGFSSGATKLGTGAPVRSPTAGKTGNVKGEFPANFSVADLKPLSVSKTGEGFAQIANYCEGMPNFVNQALADGKVTTRTKKGKPLTSLAIPAGHDMRHFKTQHKLPGDNTLIFGGTTNKRLWLYPHKSGIYFYLWLPNTFTTPGSVSNYTHTKGELTRMVTELKRPHVPTRKTLAPRRRSHTLIAKPRAKPARLLQRKPKPVPHAAGADWGALGVQWETDRSNWSTQYAKPFLDQTKSFEELIDARESLKLSKEDTEAALGADFAAQAKEHERIEFWAGMGGKALGATRYKLGPIFDKVSAWFERIGKKFRGIQGKVEAVPGSHGIGWRKTLVTILIKGVKLAFKEFLHATYSLFADCFNGVVETITDEFIEEANDELRIYFEEIETKFHEFSAKLENEYEVSFDQMEGLVQDISDAKKWLDLALTLEGLIRTGMQVVSCLTPPALGCLWGLVAQVGIEVALDLIIDTDWFQNNIGRPQIKKVVDRYAGPTYRRIMQQALQSAGLGKYAEKVEACAPREESDSDHFYTGLSSGLRSGSPELLERRSKWEAMHRKTMLADLRKKFTGKDGKAATEDELLDLAERLGDQHPDCADKQKAVDEALAEGNGKADASTLAQPSAPESEAEEKTESSEDAPPTADAPPPDDKKGPATIPPEKPEKQEEPAPANDSAGEPASDGSIEVTATPGTPAVPVFDGSKAPFDGAAGAPIANAIVKVINPNWDHKKGAKGTIRIAAFLDGNHVATAKHVAFVVVSRYYFPDRDNPDTATDLVIEYQLPDGVSFRPYISGGLAKNRVIRGRLAWGKKL